MLVIVLTLEVSKIFSMNSSTISSSASAPLLVSAIFAIVSPGVAIEIEVIKESRQTTVLVKPRVLEMVPGVRVEFNARGESPDVAGLHVQQVRPEESACESRVH
jgi:hypothetical protein